MGRWSRHPMGSDGALDAKDEFMADFDIKVDDKIIYYFERDKENIRNCLLNLTLEQLKDMASRPLVSENKFVIPYTFTEYYAYPKDPEIKRFLLECLDFTADFKEYGNGKEETHVQLFKDNFEDIISGNKILTQDTGLIAAIADAMESGMRGLINRTRDNS